MLLSVNVTVMNRFKSENFTQDPARRHDAGVNAGVDPGQLACSAEKDKKEKEYTDDLYEDTAEIDEEELEGMVR